MDSAVAPISFLTVLILIPIVSSIFVFISGEDDLQNAKLVAVWSNFLVLVFSTIIICNFDFANKAIQFVEKYDGLEKYVVGVDRFSILFVAMISLISFLSMLWIFSKKIRKTKHFFVGILFFEAFAIGAFVSYDLILLVFFMEASIVPLLVMMYASGKDQNKNAIRQFLLYSVLSALFMIVGTAMIINDYGTSNIFDIYSSQQTKNTPCFWLLMIGLGIKMPIFPLYFWLPTVHVKTPTVCSCILAAIVLKFSALILVRIIHPIFFAELQNNVNLLSILCLFGAFSACSSLFFQNDLKKFFAYFSILHTNLYMFALLYGDVKNYTYIMLYHSFLMPLLFFITDVVKTVLKTRKINDLKQTTSCFLNIKCLMFGAVLVIIGAPLTWGFTSEIISIYSASKTSSLYAAISSFIILVSSVYTFYLYQTSFGKWTSTSQVNTIEMFYASNTSKKIVLSIIFGIMLVFGVFAKILLNYV